MLVIGKDLVVSCYRECDDFAVIFFFVSNECRPSDEVFVQVLGEDKGPIVYNLSVVGPFNIVVKADINANKVRVAAAQGKPMNVKVDGVYLGILGELEEHIL